MQKHAQGKTCTGIEASPNRSISEGSLLSIHPGKIPSALLVDKGAGSTVLPEVPRGGGIEGTGEYLGYP